MDTKILLKSTTLTTLCKITKYQGLRLLSEMSTKYSDTQTLHLYFY